MSKVKKGNIMENTLEKPSLLTSISRIKIGSLARGAIAILGGNSFARGIYVTIISCILGYMSASWLCPDYMGKLTGSYLLLTIALGFLILGMYKKSIKILLFCFPLLSVVIGISHLEFVIGQGRAYRDIGHYTTSELKTKNYNINIASRYSKSIIPIIIGLHNAKIKGSTNTPQITYVENKLCIQGIPCLTIDPNNGDLTSPDGSHFGQIYEILALQDNLDNVVTDSKKSLQTLGLENGN
jgi:hypothetical protein